MNNGADRACDLANALVRGGEIAFKSFRRLSGGYWLGHAPEYFLTSYAAAAIGDAKKTTALIEASVAETRAQAAAVPQGRPHGEDRRNGRFDIVLYWANGNPRAGVEVKSGFWCADKTRLRPDFVRLCRTLAANRDSTFQFCLFLYYAAVDEPERRYANASERLARVIDAIHGYAVEVASEHGLKTVLIRPTINCERAESGAWAIGASAFVRHGGERAFAE